LSLLSRTGTGGGVANAQPATRPRDAALDIGGVEEHVNELGVIESSVAERLEIAVELAADAADFALGDPARHAERFDEVVDLAGAHAMHVGLHHHRKPDATATLVPMHDAQEW
jgi:hypothetical protein